MNAKQSVGYGGKVALCVSIVAGWVAATGCNPDSLLDNPVIDRVESSVIDDPARASLIVDGVQGTFECGFNAYVLMTGVIGPELQDFPSRSFAFSVLDRRAEQAAGSIDGIYAFGDCASTDLGNIGIYRPLQTARWFAEDATKKLAGWTDAQVANRQSLIAQTTLYAAFGYVMLGEGFCSMAIDGGPEIQPADVFRLAETAFTNAMAVAQTAGRTDLLNAARIGRARVRLNLGNSAGALADARATASDAVFNATFSTVAQSRNNYEYLHNIADNAITVEDGYRNLTWEGVPDPRVRVIDTQQRLPARPEYWRQQKYLAATTPIAIAKADEARLIIAEIQGGQEAVDIINALHATAGIPSFASGDAATIDNQVIQERQRTFFLEGRRVYDMIRRNIPFLPAAGTPHPYNGGVYGTNTCLPLPNDERFNNPNIGQGAQ